MRVGARKRAGASQVTGSADVLTTLLSRGIDASKLGWCYSSGSLGANRFQEEIWRQAAWRRKEFALGGQVCMCSGKHTHTSAYARVFAGGVLARSSVCGEFQFARSAKVFTSLLTAGARTRRSFTEATRWEQRGPSDLVRKWGRKLHRGGMGGYSLSGLLCMFRSNIHLLYARGNA